MQAGGGYSFQAIDLHPNALTPKAVDDNLADVKIT